MALPIAPTPTLSGKTAKRFLAMIEEGLKHPSGSVPTPGLEEARKKVLESIHERSLIQTRTDRESQAESRKGFEPMVGLAPRRTCQR